MIHQTIMIGDGSSASLKTYIHDPCRQQGNQTALRPAVIVMPGGAYAYLEESEGEPVALTFLKEGFQTFVLSYSVGEACSCARILEEVSLAIWEVRRRADEWHINPNAIVLMGFSAGACLAAMSATQWNTPGLAERLGREPQDIKPDAAVVAYAPWDNTNTIQKDPKYFNPMCPPMIKDCPPELDFIHYAGTHMPPMFLWHNRYDNLVPAINPVMIAAKMLELDLPFELHIFQGGNHGMSVSNCLSTVNEHTRQMAKDCPSVGLWVSLCTSWIYDLFAKQGENA